MTIVTILIILFLIEIFLKPRLDFTREKKLLLWYGKRTRNYIVLF